MNKLHKIGVCFNYIFVSQNYFKDDVICSALIVLSPARITASPPLINLLPDSKFPNKIVPNVPNNVPRNPPSCSFTLFSIVSLTPIFKKNRFFERSNYFNNILHFFIWNYQCCCSQTKYFLWTCASAADAVVNPNGI